jgi:hypothetical protein
MKRLAAAVLLVTAGMAATSEAGNLDLRIGGFFPRADTGSTEASNFDLFRDHSELYTVERSDWKGVFGGAQYNAGIARHFELGIGIDGYSRANDTVYRDYVDPAGRDIPQTLKFSAVPMSLTLRLVPGGRRARVAPYVGIGGDLFFWKYEAFGDFIDFQRAGRPISSDAFESTGVTPGFHVVGGLRVPISHDFGIVGEARYQWGEANMGDDFRFNKIDLTGASVTVGFNVRF